MNHYVIPAHLVGLEAGTSGSGGEMGGFYLWGLIAEFADIVVGSVMILLLVFSLICWVIIIYKGIYLRLAQSESNKFLETFWEAKRLDAIYQTSEELKRSPLAQVFKAGYQELSKQKGQEAQEGEAMHEHLGDIECV